ncbi:MAG: hypothetical protein AB7V46_04025 [Thermomicrobiales bacterium]
MHTSIGERPRTCRFPQASAIRFVVDGDDLVMDSRPTATRLANIAIHPELAFTLPGYPKGDETLSGEGMPPTTIKSASSMQKHESEILRLNSTYEEHAGLCAVASRVTVTRVRHCVHSQEVDSRSARLR